MTKACLYCNGKEASERERLVIVVIGVRRKSRQDLRRVVGISSRQQVESDELRMAFLTSSGEAGEKAESNGGYDEGAR